MLTVAFLSGRWYDTRHIGRFSAKTAIVTGQSIKDKTLYHGQLSQCPARHAGLRSRSRSGRVAGTRLLSALDCPGGAAAGGFRRFRRAECATSQLCACETCRTRCRGCKVSQVLLALCLSAVSYYDDAMSEVEPARGPFNIAYSGFKREISAAMNLIELQMTGSGVTSRRMRPPGGPATMARLARRSFLMLVRQGNTCDHV